MPQVTPEEIKNQLNSIKDEVKDAVDKVNEEVQNHGKIGRDNKKSLDNLTNQIEEVTARVLDIEQHGTSQKDIEDNIQSIGAEFTDSEPFNQFAIGNTTKASFETQNNLNVGSDQTVAPDRRPGVVGAAFRKLRVLDTLPSGETTSNAVEYTRENLFTNNAAETQEGNFAYPESDIGFELINVPVRNIGHFIYVSKQMIEDAPAIASYINGRLYYGCEYRKDKQALTGDGTGQNLDGLFKTGNYLALPGTVSGDGQYKNVRRAIAQVELADYSAEVVYLNPADCADIDLLEGSDSHFISANPRVQNAKTLWGLPVVETNAMPAGKFLTGAVSQAAQFTNRRNIIIEMTDAHDDNFTKDIVTLKATCRAAMEIWRPGSMVGGDLVVE